MDKNLWFWIHFWVLEVSDLEDRSQFFTKLRHPYGSLKINRFWGPEDLNLWIFQTPWGSGRGQRPLLRAKGPQMPSKTVGCQGQSPWTQGQRPWEGSGGPPGGDGGGPRRGPEEVPEGREGVWGVPQGGKRTVQNVYIIKRLVFGDFSPLRGAFGPPQSWKISENRSKSATLLFFVSHFFSLFFAFFNFQKPPYQISTGSNMWQIF